MIRSIRYPALISIIIGAFSASTGGLGAWHGETAPAEEAMVIDVYDGDTIVVQRGVRQATVRLIGVDTPETSRPETPVQFHGPEAADFTRRSLLGKIVRLEFEPPDRPGGAIDKYDRMLASVFTPDGKNFNLELVRLGYGRAYTVYPFTQQRTFEKAGRAAKKAGLGMWNREQRARWTDPATRGRVIGNIRSRVYHLPGQDGYTKVLEKNRVYFDSEEEAVTAGYRKARN
jgi:micrococcal nuclease